jgi:hypothetical protein
VTARDEAIEALYNDMGCLCKRDGEECGACRSDATRQLDLVMPFVVRLAIEQDALEEQSLAAWWMQDTDPLTPLFRVVKP